MLPQFKSFVRKEFRHILRDRRTMLLLFGLPLVQMLIFGFALTNEVKNSKIAILDMAKDDASRVLIERFDVSKYFDIAVYSSNMEEVETAFRQNQIRMAIIIPQHFNHDLLHAQKAQVQLITDASDPNIATTIANYAQAIIGDYQNELMDPVKLPYRIITETRMLYNPQLKGAYTFVPGVMAMLLMLISAMMTAVAIVKEKEMGTMEILLVSPMQPLMIILAKVVPYLTLSFINVINILLLSYFVLDVPIRGSLILLLGSSILFILCSLAIGLLISSSTSSQRVAMFISLMGLLMPTLLFSGFMFPVENMPIPMQVISNLVPAKWFFYIVRAVMIKGLSITAIWKELLILSAMTLFFIAISFKKFKIRLE
ncbi:MAG: ABC transporter permease [Saprospiraceae bacterium]